MWILPALGLLGTLLSFTFLTLSIASGLYYLSELVEEHTRLTSFLLRRLIYGIIAFLVFLWLIDSFPFFLTVTAIASHILYLGNLRHFPTVKLSDPVFIGSCIAVGLQHWLWFRWFSGTKDGQYGYGGGTGDRYGAPVQQPPSFTEVASFFGICVWLVPFALFVSLSAGENVLPSMGSEYATGPHGTSSVGSAGGSGVDSGLDGKQGKKNRSIGLAKAGIDRAREYLAETGATMGLWRNENVRSF